tara:strand:+ start:47 stop:379 length:333 start_codon:yes stop_codon:yes gene_type:complete
MSKLSQQDEKELVTFIKGWLKVHGYSQKDLANELKIKSGRTSEIILKIREIYKKGGIFSVAKNLINVEQNWINNIRDDSVKDYESQPYNQLDIDSLVKQINIDSDEKDIS